jgi:hypothetical protein
MKASSSSEIGPRDQAAAAAVAPPNLGTSTSRSRAWWERSRPPAARPSRWSRALFASALAATFATVSERVDADLENGVFTSKRDAVRLVVPRGWRATELPSYPGALLWMLRSQPEGTIALTAEPFTRRLYCSWPTTCRSPRESLAAQYACALRGPLTASRLHVGPIQAGPRENAEAGAPSVWFEYDDGRHYVRQAIAISDDRAVSLVLATPSADARTAHVRAFEQALRSLRAGPATTPPSAAPDPAPSTPDRATTPADGAAPEPPRDAGAGTATGPATDAGPPPAPAAPTEAPVGPCP